MANDDHEAMELSVARAIRMLHSRWVRGHEESPRRDEPDKLQTLKDYRLTIEYKHLKQNAPGGVFVIPSVNHLRVWYGVIFVRRGHYANGIFKFRVELPADYNDVDTWPIIVFTSSVFNPMVNPRTGALDLKSVFPEWVPGKHYMVTALTYLKKVFYMKDFSFSRPANPEAQTLFQDDKRGFLERVEACVRESQERVYENEERSSLRFTEPKPAHDKLRDKILGVEVAARALPTQAGARDPEKHGTRAEDVAFDCDATIGVSSYSRQTKSLGSCSGSPPPNATVAEESRPVATEGPLAADSISFP